MVRPKYAFSLTASDACWRRRRGRGRGRERKKEEGRRSTSVVELFPNGHCLLSLNFLINASGRSRSRFVSRERSSTPTQGGCIFSERKWARSRRRKPRSQPLPSPQGRSTVPESSKARGNATQLSQVCAPLGIFVPHLEAGLRWRSGRRMPFHFD